MSSAITVRRVPQQVVEAVARRAARERRSTQQLLVTELCRRVETLDKDEWLELAERTARLIDAQITPEEIVAGIRADRDRP